MSEAKLDHDAAVKKLGKLISDIQYAMLTTAEPDGTLRSRPMATHFNHNSKEFDGTLWFFTKDHSPKVDEVQQDHHVGISFASPEQSTYVSVSGMATLVKDRKKNEELWTDKYIAWFPKGLDEPELALLKVTVDKAEYWDTPSSTVAHITGFVKATLTGKPHHAGDHDKIEM